MRLDYLTQELWIEEPKENWQPRYQWQEPLKLELQNFADCILTNKQPVVTGADGLKALQIAEAALSSSSKNRVITLEL